MVIEPEQVLSLDVHGYTRLVSNDFVNNYESNVMIEDLP